jgi:DNA polymerase III epsilon subunit-like protein
VLAKQRVKGVKNYKLVTIAKELGVELENAHRAVFDAVATAEVMINLLKNN